MAEQFKTSEDYSEQPGAVDARIRRLARKDQYKATKRRGLWYFVDHNNYLQSPEQGLDDENALRYLLGFAVAV